MRLIFDYQCFQDQPYGGISRYFAELITGLRRDFKIDIKQFSGFTRTRCGSITGGSSLPNALFTTPALGQLVRTINRVNFELWALTQQADIYHATYFRNLVGPRNAFRVVTVHDCIHEKFLAPAGVDLKGLKWKYDSIQAADCIICVSENTRTDLMKLYNISSDLISVVYHGVADAFVFSEQKKKCAQRYLLFVGARHYYKNFAVLREAFERFGELSRDFELICIGGGPLTTNEIPVRARVRHIRSTSDYELASFYGAAVALIYPSLYEGFGLPILEAMRCGCPVITTKGGAIPEIAGAAAEFFDAKSSEDLMRAIYRLASDPSYRERRIMDGRRRAAEFTWERCVKETIGVYEKVLRQGGPRHSG